MPWRVREIRLPLDGDEGALLKVACRRAGVPAEAVERLEIVRRSLDRRRGELTFSFSVDLHLVENGKSRAVPGAQWVDPVSLPPVPLGDRPLTSPPVVVGTGPAGLFAALHLARRGFRPVVLERGDRMNHRVGRIRDLNRDGILDPESNYLFGEGGAGTFSDGKLTCRSKDPRARQVLDTFREASGVTSIMWDYRPHLGSDRVRAVVGRLRQEILSLGGVFHFRCRCTGLTIRQGSVVGVMTDRGEMAGSVVVLAPGHSARDLYRSLHAQGVAMERKAFQLGLRIEHPQEFIDRRVWGRHGGLAHLGPADYRLSVQSRLGPAFSFCMCPGGEMIPAVSDPEHMNTNGMSWSGKGTGFGNSGLVTTLEPHAFPGEGVLAGLVWQEELEAQAASQVAGGLALPAQRVGDWIAGRRSSDLPASSCKTGLAPSDLSVVVPEPVHRLLLAAMASFDRQIPGFSQHPDAVLVGPEARSSSPVRLLRDATGQSPGTEGLFPIGEGAGYAGGIISAAIDGVRAADAITAVFRPG